MCGVDTKEGVARMVVRMDDLLLLPIYSARVTKLLLFDSTNNFARHGTRWHHQARSLQDFVFAWDWNEQ